MIAIGRYVAHERIATAVASSFAILLRWRCHAKRRVFDGCAPSGPAHIDTLVLRFGFLWIYTFHLGYLMGYQNLIKCGIGWNLNNLNMPLKNKGSSIRFLPCQACHATLADTGASTGVAAGWS